MNKKNEVCKLRKKNWIGKISVLRTAEYLSTLLLISLQGTEKYVQLRE
jgi:hypothetical protein